MKLNMNNSVLSHTVWTSILDPNKVFVVACFFFQYEQEEIRQRENQQKIPEFVRVKDNLRRTQASEQWGSPSPCPLYTTQLATYYPRISVHHHLPSSVIMVSCIHTMHTSKCLSDTVQDRVKVLTLYLYNDLENNLFLLLWRAFFVHFLNMHYIF